MAEVIITIKVEGFEETTISGIQLTPIVFEETPPIQEPKNPEEPLVGTVNFDVNPEDSRVEISGSFGSKVWRGDGSIDLPYGVYKAHIEHIRVGETSLDIVVNQPTTTIIVDLELPPVVGEPALPLPPEEPSDPTPEPVEDSDAMAVSRYTWHNQPKVLLADWWVTQVNSLWNAPTNQREPYPVKSHEVFRKVEWQSERPGYEGYTYLETSDVFDDNGPRDWADTTNSQHGYMTLVSNYPVEVVIIGNGRPSWIDDTWRQNNNGHYAKVFPKGHIVLGAPERAYGRVALYDVAVRHANGTKWELPRLATQFDVNDGVVPPAVRKDILIVKDPQGRERFSQHPLIDEYTGWTFEHEHGSLARLYPLPHTPMYDLVENEPLHHQHAAFKDFHMRWRKFGGGIMHMFVTTYLGSGSEPNDGIQYDLQRQRWRHFEIKLYDEQLQTEVAHYWGSGDYGTFEATDGNGPPVVMAIGEKHDGVKNEDIQRYAQMSQGKRLYPYPTLPYHSTGEIKATVQGTGGYWTFRQDLGWAAMGLTGTISFQHNDPAFWVASKTNPTLVKHSGQNGWIPNAWGKRWFVPHHRLGVSAIDLYQRMVYRGFKETIEEARQWHIDNDGYVYTNDWEMNDSRVITPAGTLFLDKDDPRATIKNYQRPDYEGQFDTNIPANSPSPHRFFTSGNDDFLGGGNTGWWERDYFAHLPQKQSSFSANALALATKN